VANVGAGKSLSSIRSDQPSSEGGRGARMWGHGSINPVRQGTHTQRHAGRIRVSPEHVNRHFAAQQQRLVPKLIHSLILRRHPSEQFYTDCCCQGAQAPQLWRCRLKASRSQEVGRLSMSKADQFRQYAADDLRWARRSTIDEEKKALLELAHHWMQAAVQSESTVVGQLESTRTQSPATSP
jgi:hypothetical protein